MQLDDRTLFLLCWRGQRVGAREEWKPEVYGNINCNIAQYFVIEKVQSSESQQQKRRNRDSGRSSSGHVVCNGLGKRRTGTWQMTLK